MAKLETEYPECFDTWLLADGKRFVCTPSAPDQTVHTHLEAEIIGDKDGYKLRRCPNCKLEFYNGFDDFVESL